MTESESRWVTVIVPAAGAGSRLREAGHPKKQFRLLGGEPVLIRTLEALRRHSAVRQVVVAAPEEDVAAIGHELGRWIDGATMEVLAGGRSRQESVWRALQAVDPSADFVAVHDGVRPFLSLDRLTAVIEAAWEVGAAALAMPAADTLRRADAGQFGNTVDRTDLWQMQTPQIFRAGLLAEAHASAPPEPVTDDVELVLRTGVPVQAVEGSRMNFKITTPSDWDLARILWPQWRARNDGE